MAIFASRDKIVRVASRSIFSRTGVNPTFARPSARPPHEGVSSVRVDELTKPRNIYTVTLPVPSSVRMILRGLSFITALFFFFVGAGLRAQHGGRHVEER